MRPPIEKWEEIPEEGLRLPPCPQELAEIIAYIRYLEAAMEKIIEVSDNDGGSASDAIQDMLEIARAIGEQIPASSKEVRD